ncbi:transcription factor TFIIIB component B'' [Ceratitis capitata]|uniref:(Mediterranean fruit fly) hypothetical protein n=1 Tax=Ceratitis capitata TaxID=7213 RepID=A0A811UFB9_CERCA|nr:transcription factor TFIIIB component B'' [Ceratitis capitata]CAD6997038.1 unnamed protein product [Ceratitis capitata]
MAMRRPRIKATALLTTKRKSRDVKTELTTKTVAVEENADESIKNIAAENVDTVKKGITELITASKDETEKSTPITEVAHIEHKSRTIEDEKKCTEPDSESVSEVDGIKLTDTNELSSKTSKNDTVKENNISFKCPARVQFTLSNNHTTEYICPDDAFYTDMEESILQSDMQKTANDYANSPSKQQPRQRIRPVPLFQRRNSLVGAASPLQNSLDDSAASTDMHTDLSKSTIHDNSETLPIQKSQLPLHRRERHYSASMAQTTNTPNSTSCHHHYTPHKFTPAMGINRIRTESNCSAFSDSFIPPSKVRKTDDHNSSRPGSRRDISLRIVNGNLDKSSLKMFDLIYYNPVTNPMEKRSTLPAVKKESTPDVNDTKPLIVESKGDAADGASNAMPVPQLKLNANGDLILDEKTLEIETTAEQEARKVLANSSLIFLDENTGMNGFYKRQKRTKDWPPEETIKFYRCLQTVGTDFSLMCQLFPKRTRRDLKLKFKKEERSNLALINKALLYPKLFNIDDLKTQLETEEREREESIKRWKEIHEKEAKTIKKVKINSSSAARALKNGDDIYENENIVKQKLSKRSNASEKKKTEVSKNPIKALPQQTPADFNGNAPTALKNLKRRSKQNITHNSKPKDQPCNEMAYQTPKEVTSVKLEVLPTNYPVKTEHSTRDNQIVEADVDMASRIDEIAEQFINIIAPSPNPEETFYGNDNVINTEAHTSFPSKEVAEVESKTFVDLDDGTVNTLIGEQDPSLLDVMPATPASTSQREVDECDIQQILMDLSDGSLVLVSTLDPENADQVVNEIYMMDKVTGELCEKPLDIPESIVQCVLSVMS